jgi:hypothetical protein
MLPDPAAPLLAAALTPRGELLPTLRLKEALVDPALQSRFSDLGGFRSFRAREPPRAFVHGKGRYRGVVAHHQRVDDRRRMVRRAQPFDR